MAGPSAVFNRDLSALYEAFRRGEDNPLKPLPVQYADYALWQRERLEGEELERQLAYWKSQLADAPALALPTDLPRPLQPSFAGARHSLVLPPEIAARLKELSRQENATLFMTLLAAFQLLLCRYSGQEDISVGIPAANRNHLELEELIGFFLDTLVLRTDLSGGSVLSGALAPRAEGHSWRPTLMRTCPLRGWCRSFSPSAASIKPRSFRPSSTF